MQKLDEMLQNSTVTSIKYSKIPIPDFRGDPGLSAYNFEKLSNSATSFTLDMRKIWAVNLGSCADCDPLVLEHDAGASHLVIMGTHDGGLHAVDAQNGNVFWVKEINSEVFEKRVYSVAEFHVESCGIFTVALDALFG